MMGWTEEKQFPFIISHSRIQLESATSGRTACSSKRMRAFNFEIASEPSRPVLAVASACYPDASGFCTAAELAFLSLRWSKEKTFRDRAFCKHLARWGEGRQSLLPLKVESIYHF